MKYSEFLSNGLFTDGKVEHHEGVVSVHRLLVGAVSETAREAWEKDPTCTVRMPASQRVADILLKFCYDVSTNVEKSLGEDVLLDSGETLQQDLVQCAIAMKMCLFLEVYVQYRVAALESRAFTNENENRLVFLLAFTVRQSEEFMSRHSCMPAKARLVEKCSAILPYLVDKYPNAWHVDSLEGSDSVFLPNRAHWVLEGPVERPELVSQPYTGDYRYYVNWTMHTCEGHSEHYTYRYDQCRDCHSIEPRDPRVHEFYGHVPEALYPDFVITSLSKYPRQFNVHKLTIEGSDWAHYVRIEDDYLYALNKLGCLTLVIDLRRQKVWAFKHPEIPPEYDIPELRDESCFEHLSSREWLVDLHREKVYAIIYGHIFVSPFSLRDGTQEDYTMLQADGVPSKMRPLTHLYPSPDDRPFCTPSLEPTGFGFLFCEDHSPIQGPVQVVAFHIVVRDSEKVVVEEEKSGVSCYTVKLPVKVKTRATLWTYSPVLRQLAVNLQDGHTLHFDLGLRKALSFRKSSPDTRSVPAFRSRPVLPVRDPAPRNSLNLLECMNPAGSLDP